jgi:pSer/pThr/pTyr-binding forkhead associated (FHA) protein
MTQPDEQANAPMPPRAVTMLESVEEIRAQVRGRATVKESVQVPPAGSTSPAVPVDDTVIFRPLDRPPAAMLVVLDDGEDEGETVRIKRESFVIGRVQGDLVIPHDGNISGRHAEIQRRFEGGRWQWYLRDLESLNGTFVRVASGILRDGQEVLIGGSCFRFEVSQLDQPGEPVTAAPAAGATRKWAGGSIAQLERERSPALVALTDQGPGARYPLDRPEQWVGRDATQCSIILDDPLCSPRHARIYRDAKSRWMIQNNRARNGLWMRINEVCLERGGQFQCGEQRFLIRIP